MQYLLLIIVCVSGIALADIIDEKSQEYKAQSKCISLLIAKGYERSQIKTKGSSCELRKSAWK